MLYFPHCEVKPRLLGMNQVYIIVCTCEKQACDMSGNYKLLWKQYWGIHIYLRILESNTVSISKEVRAYTSGASEFTLTCSGFLLVAQSSVFCLLYSRPLLVLSLCPFSCGSCVLYPSIYGFWLSIVQADVLYLQLLLSIHINIQLSMLAILTFVAA